MLSSNGLLVITIHAENMHRLHATAALFQFLQGKYFNKRYNNLT